MGELSDAGLALYTSIEAGPDGGIATKSYQCSADVWTISLGVTHYPDGRPVGPGDQCTRDEAVELANWTLRDFGACVDRVITKPMTPNQRSAFTLLAVNIGKDAFEHNCTAARLFNDGADPIDVATAFGRWCKATSKSPDDADIGKPYYASIMARKGGDWIWIDADGNKTTYFRAMPGLLRASLSKACLFMELDWRQACRKDTVSITSERVWDPKDTRWEDIVRKKTEFPDVYALAKKFPLSPDLVLDKPIPTPSPAPASNPPGNGAGTQKSPNPSVVPVPPSVSPSVTGPTAKPVDATTAPAARPDPLRPAGQAGGVVGYDAPKSTSASGAVVAAKPVDTKPPPPPVPLPPSVQVNSTSDMGGSVKSMYRSKRFWGGILIIAGRLIIVADVGGNFAPAIRSFIGDGVLMDWMTGVIVTMIGELILDRGEKKAEGPIDTPKRVALMTPAP